MNARLTLVALLCAIMTAAIAPQTCRGQDEGWQAHISPPLVFASSQLKYGLYQNYLHRYMDRPLFMDRSLRERAVVTCPSFWRIMDHAMMYEMDGLGAIIGTPGMIQRYRIAMDCATQQAPEGFTFFPLFGGGPEVDYKSDTLDIAAAAPVTARLDGRMVFGTYGGDTTPPEQLARMLADLRAQHGDFLYLIAITQWRDAHDEFRAEGVTPETDAALREHIRTYLEVADGIDFTYGVGFRRPDRTFDVEFYREYVVPTLKSVLSEPEYRDRWLRLGAAIGYYQFMSGSWLDEDGTRTLRNSFEAAMDAEPDMIGMAEWDELNEHTCIEPTVTNSLSTQRIIRHYMRTLHGEPPAPNPGDDTSIPNLIVSFRKALTLGEKLQVELLNVPDGGAGEYSVTPALLGADGAELLAGAPVVFNAAELMEHRWTVPSETLAGQTVLRPSLRITTADGRELAVADGLHHVTLRPSDNWDYKWVKQPLRDMIAPSEASFAMVPAEGGAGQWTVRGAIACDEPLASVEVLENDDEVYGVDVGDEYPAATDQRDRLMLLRVDIRAMHRYEMVGRLWIDGCQAQFHTETDGRYFFNEGNGVRANMWFGQWRRVFFATIPRNQVPRGTLHLDFTELQGEIPLGHVSAHGLYSQAFDPDVQVTLQDFQREPDLPPHINAPDASFEFAATPRRPNSVFHLRAITVSGKTWRSAPVLIAGREPAGPVTLDVFSDTDGATTQVEVDASAVPDIAYDFLPENGSLMWTDAGVPFCGQVGGRAEAVTFVGGGESGGMGDPFRNGGLYPEDASATAAPWVEADGAPALHFDGVGNFIALPREVTPRRNGWALSFEIRPTGADALAKRQILWRHHGHYIGSVTVYLEDGEIWTTYTDGAVNTTEQRPGLRLPLNEWSRVEISYDLDTMQFRVNGQLSEPLLAPGPGLYIGTSVFGGHGSGTEYFEGDLRALRMLHRATLQHGE